MQSGKKIIAIVGPTASGKSDLTVELALWIERNQEEFKFKGAEVISADSRQVYKGMDIGTGKITKEEMKGIPHHLLDVASPKRKFTVAQYKNKALATVEKIFNKNKVPILVGGTGFYMQSVIDGIAIPEVPPDWELRKRLDKKTKNELYERLKKTDPRRAEEVKYNKRKLIRALEIVNKTKKPVPPLERKPLPYPVLMLGIKIEIEELKELIRKRLLKRMEQGMIEEVKKLKESGVSWQRIEEFGLEYRWIGKYLQNKVTREEMLERLQKDIENFAKRQMRWFLQDNRINWIENYNQAQELVKEFLKKK